MLLDPVSPRDFLGEHWDARARHIQGHAGKFSDLFDRQAWKAALPGCRMLKAGYH